MQNLDIYTAYFMSGLTYIVMPIVSWVAMSKEHNRPVRLWCIGGICVGLGLLLMAMRGKVPDMLSYLLANALISAGELSRIQALRIESKRSLSFWTLLGIWIVFLLIFEYTRTILQDAKLRLIWGCLFHSYTFFSLAYWSFRLSRQAFFKVARWISVGYLILGSMFVVRATQLSINSIESNLITNSSVGFSIPILAFFCAIIVHFGYIGMSLDRSIMQMRLQQSELEYRTLADSGPLFVRIQNNEHICEYVNATWLKFTGKSFADAIKQNWQQFIHPDDQVEFYTAYQNFWLNHQAFSIIFRIQQADTTYRWLDEYCAPRYNTEGQFIGCIICGLDITDRKALEESNTQNKLSFLEKIAQLDRQRSLGMLSASLAHELNQPLNTILLSADLLRQETDKDSIPPNLIQSLTDNIIQCTRHSEQIIANIQKFIKPHELEKHPVDLQDLMKYTTDLLKKEAQFHQVKFHLPASKDEAWTQGDFILLSQVLINIFRNSIDALKHVEQRDVYLELFFNSTNWHLVIKDSGPGLSELVLNKIATPFFTTKHSGLGMGLSISKDIIEQHHGSLLIGNNQTGGAYFEMVLPMI